MRLFRLHKLSILITLGATAAIGCGGADGPDPDAEVATTAGGQTITTASGDQVTVEAHNHWTEGLALYAEAVEQGWNSERCSSIVDKFDEANSAQGGGFVEALHMAGLSAYNCDDRDTAESRWEDALEADAGFCKARAGIGLLQLEAGERRDAWNTFRQSVAGENQCASGFTNLALMQMNSTDRAQRDEALSNLRRALAVESNYLPAFNQMALFYFQRGKAQGRRGRQDIASLDLAEIVCRQAQLIDADYAPIYNTWGLIKIERGDVIAALRFFEKAIELDNSMFEAQMNFAQITLSFRGYEDAQGAFSRAVELQPNNYEAILGLGASLRGLRQIPQAKAQYERAIELDGRRPEAYYNIGLLYQDYMDSTIPQLQQAVQYYDQFLERAGSEARYASTVEGINRRCRDQRSARARRRNLGPRSDCRPGRKQIIEQFIAALHEAEEMQREMEAMQREAEAMQREAEAQEAAAQEN